MIDAGLYVHVPFCATRCGYCDFYTNVPGRGEMPPLVDALIADMDRLLQRHELRIKTIFVGGGTPTLLPVELLEGLFRRLGEVAAHHRPEEFTVEANPASLADAKANILRAAGVNRISMGAQSFHQNELRVLDRLHSPADLEPSAAIVHRAGFEHFNLDLIFGIPGQSIESWRESLARAVALGPDHLSCYSLTFEPGTPLHERKSAGFIRPVAEDWEADLYQAVIDGCESAGYRQYEISNFAKPGCESKHNLRYWRNESVVSVGPSAASYLEGHRWKNIADTHEYVRRVSQGADATIDHETLSPLERAGETAMLQLRLTEGMDIRAFQETTGYCPKAVFAEQIARFAGMGLLHVSDEAIALTRAGRFVSDAILADFLSPIEANAGAA